MYSMIITRTSEIKYENQENENMTQNLVYTHNDVHRQKQKAYIYARIEFISQTARCELFIHIETK